MGRPTVRFRSGRFSCTLDPSAREPGFDLAAAARPGRLRPLRRRAARAGPRLHWCRGHPRPRAVEQLVVRDPLVLAESAGIALLPFYVSEIRWWSDPSFADGHVLRAAELVACETLDPPLRGRSRASAQVFALCEDPLFRERMAALFRSEPLGCLALPTQAHALEWLAALELRIKTLERVTDVRGTGTGGNSSDLGR